MRNKHSKLFEQVYFILVEPQLGENIGAVARVISNFGFTKLRIVSPRDGWPNAKAEELAAHGKYVLKQATILDSFQKAISDLNFILATSANSRDMVKKVERPDKAVNKIYKMISNKNKVGILLGRERSGLTNEEIVSADLLMSIPTSSSNPSLNIAQATCIVAYEISKMENKKIIYSKAESMAKKDDLMKLFIHLENELLKTGFLKIEAKRKKMIQNIRNMFIKAEMTEQEVRTFRGIISALVKR